MIGSKVNSPGVSTVEISSADTAITKATSLGVTYTEIAQAITISTEVVTADTSAPSGNDYNTLAINFHMLFLISKLLQKLWH